MIMLIGQVGRDMMDREAFQEIDYRQMFGPVAKWAAQIDVTARIPEYIARAFHVATSGRPGPVVLALPEDMLTEATQSGDAVRYQPIQPAPAPQAFASIRELLEGAKKPMILAGGPGWSDAACAQLQASPRPTAFRSRPRSAARMFWTTGRHALPATSARQDRRRWCSASRKPTCCW